VLTAATPAFLPELRANEEQGLVWARPGEPESICKAVERVHRHRPGLAALGKAARDTYERYYSNRVISDVVSELLDAGNQPDPR
jgi:hypothetical protein